MSDTTVLYYTANFEPPEFEEKIRENILKSIGSLPLVSVSSVPIENFGINICVGKHAKVYPNVYRTIRTGLEIIRTKYVLPVEDDTLYPPEYFRFEPDGKSRYYHYLPSYVIWTRGARQYHYKGFSESCEMIERDLFVELIDSTLANHPGWSGDGCAPIRRVTPFLNRRCIWKGNPVVIFKTGKSISNRSPISRKHPPVSEIAYWGSADDLLKEMRL